MKNENKRTILFLRGIQGCGKSTLRRQRMAKDPSFVTLSRDDIRQSIWGDNYYKTGGINKKENIVTKMWKAQLRIALLNGNNVILDEMNISARFLTATFAYIKYIAKIGLFDLSFDVIELMDVPLETCLRNNENRVGTFGYVPPEIIKKTHNRAKSGKRDWYKKYAELISDEAPMKIEQNPNNKKAMIFDMDGTLSLFNGRSPFDYSKVHLDSINKSVYQLYLDVKKANRHAIIIVTGRLGTDECQEKTKYWLEKHGIVYDEIHFRPATEETKKDSIIKEEIWKDLTSRYYIDLMIDDRTQVVEHARLCGFDALQFTFGDF